MKTLRFGIEIETVGLGKEGAARAIAAVGGGGPRPPPAPGTRSPPTGACGGPFPMGA